MDFLHRTLNLNAGSVVEVTLDRQANVLLLDTLNFHCYRSGQPFRYHGGLATASPVHLRPPHAGQWHLVIDLGGGSGLIRHSIRIIH